MKTITMLLLVCFNVSSLFSQQDLKLSLKKDTDEPLSKSEHVYVFEISNTSKTDTSFKIQANNTACSNPNNRSAQLLQEVDLIQTVVSSGNGRSKTSDISLKPGEVHEFSIKISRPQNTKLNTRNCTEIIAQSNKGTSNSISINTFIPNPKDFN